MKKQEKIYLFEKNYDLLWIINFLGGWVFQRQLLQLSGKLGYESATNFKEKIKLLEENRLIKRENWNGNYKIIKLANFSLERLTSGNQNRSSIQIPKNTQLMCMRVLINELIIELILGLKKERIDFKEIENLSYVDWNTLVLLRNHECLYLTKIYNKFKKYIDLENYNDIFTSTAFGLYNSKKGLLTKQQDYIYDKNLSISKNIYDKMVSERIPYIRDFDFNKVFSNNIYIKYIILKDNMFHIKVLYLTNSAIDINPILLKLKRVDNFFKLLFEYNVCVDIDYEIITTSEEKKHYLEKSLLKSRKFMDIKVSTNNINDKYLLKRNFL